MRILVTGHHGYIGSILTKILQSAGHHVVGVDTNLYERCVFGAFDTPRIPAIRKDIRDLLPRDIEYFDAIAHLAGICNDPLGDLLPETTMDINFEATCRLARLAKAVGVERFVFSSSCSIYGAATEDWIDETSPPNPVTPYGRSKLEAERELTRLADSRFSPIFLRSATAYGYSPFIRFDLVLNNLVAYAFTKGCVLLKSDGSPWRPIVHIEDISRAFLAALEAPRDLVHNAVFNVGVTTENYRIREIAEIVERTVPGSRVEYAPGASPDKRTYRVDCTKIARMLPGFRPQWTAPRGILELLEKYRTTGLTLEDFEGSRYQRLAHLQALLGRHQLDDSLRWTEPAASAMPFPPHLAASGS